MYETHFGFTGTPFGLNPDPAFFFGSKGHSSALSYLKFGVYQGEGFVVVTGEIGAGKTTLVATLLSELDQKSIVAAQIVSTQLDSGDLLRSVALAFGIAPKNLSKAELIATIEAFLTLLVTENKRALLIVDEAQNLSREAVEELRMLSNFQLGSRALLQSFLVGQPELRQLLTAKPMEQFRQRVIASCHLGPMDRTETQAYIEHRLHQVGWKENPAFEAEAFDHIFRWTSGIPRRVNLLCNRLLLSAYLSDNSRIDAEAVDVVAHEARVEVSTPTAVVVDAAVGAAVAATAVAPAPTRVAMTAAGASHAAPPMPAPAVPAQPAAAAPAQVGPMFLVGASLAEDVKMALLSDALRPHAGVVGAQVRVRVGEPARFALNDELLGKLGVIGPSVVIDVDETPGSEQMADVLKRFATLVDEHRPGIVAVSGDSDAALACALAAAKKGCRVAHVDAGRRGAVPAAPEQLNGVLIDRLAALFYPSETATYLNLIREGLDDARVQHAGDLMVDAARLAQPYLPAAHAVLQHRLSRSLADALKSGYGLVSLDATMLHADRETIADAIARLHVLAGETPLVWPMPRAVRERLLVLGVRTTAEHERITIIDPPSLTEALALVKAAAFVVADSRDARMQAAVMRVRCLWLDPGRPGPLAPMAAPALPGDESAARIAEHLARFMAGGGTGAA